MGAIMADGDIIWTQRKRNWCRTPFTFTVYTLTSDELVVQSGLLSQTFDTTKLFRIVDFTITRSLLQRVFGLSTIVVEARDQSSGGRIVLKNRVGTREFMGAGDGYDAGPVDGDFDGDGIPDYR